MKDEVVIIPTYNRPEMLALCLRRIRTIEPSIKIRIFPDRGTADDGNLLTSVNWADPNNENTQITYVPKHDYYGNSFNVMEALRWAYNYGAERVFYIEDDVMVHENFFSWHREVLDDMPELFASMAWVFNREAPILDDLLFQPWYYAIGTCFQRNTLRLVIEHATPRYYADMAAYVAEEFKDTYLNWSRPQFGIEHYEQDGLIQRVIDRHKLMTASSGIAKCTHLGFYGYNRGWRPGTELFKDCLTFEHKIARLVNLLEDEYERIELFGRQIVERELGREVPKRQIRYRAKIGEYTTEFTSERVLRPGSMPARIGSVRVTPGMVIEKIS